jgi:hypothetical protein
MKKIYLISIALVFATIISKAQTTAMDFNRADCSGQMHHLFSELDSGNLVIMEFIMTCNSCIAAGNAIEAMIADLQTEYPGKIRWYQFAYTNTYTCATMTGFKNTNGFTSAVFDQGAAMVAYYGGFGMPTIAVAAGAGHDVLFTDVGFSISDTTAMGIAARNFFATSAVNELPKSLSAVNVFPNPTSDLLSINLNVNIKSEVSIQLTDNLGRMVMDIFSSVVNAGEFAAKADISSIPAGNYNLQVICDDKLINRKITISR